MEKKNYDNRKNERLKCQFNGFLYFINEVVEVRVADISRTGLCLTLKSWVSAAPGATVRLRTSELGMVEGTVRWYRSGRMGVHLAETSNTAAQVASYFRHFHKSAMPDAAGQLGRRRG
jgi:hypothetical protein